MSEWRAGQKRCFVSVCASITESTGEHTHTKDPTSPSKPPFTHIRTYAHTAAQTSPWQNALRVCTKTLPTWKACISLCAVFTPASMTLAFFFSDSSSFFVISSCFFSSARASSRSSRFSLSSHAKLNRASSHPAGQTVSSSPPSPSSPSSSLLVQSLSLSSSSLSSSSESTGQREGQKMTPQQLFACYLPPTPYNKATPQVCTDVFESVVRTDNATSNRK